jgi:hypothetical protein
LKRARLIVGVTIVIGVALFGAHYKILLRGDCESPEHLRLSRFRGQVVGKSLGVLQYRWLRRRFNATGTQLTLEKVLPDSYYEGNLIKNSSLVGEQEIGRTGAFDFGELPQGDYSLTVRLPGEDAVGFGFSIDPRAQHAKVLIDASPGYYCWCCGWNFEPR